VTHSRRCARRSDLHSANFALMTGPRLEGRVTCAPMTMATRADALRLLGQFLGGDAHYRASAAAYGDGGPHALSRALDLFLARPEIGFVWLATVDGDAAGACVVCRAISTSRGGLVAKLDDVTVDVSARGEGIGAAMLASLIAHLRAGGVMRRAGSVRHRPGRRAEQTPAGRERPALRWRAGWRAAMLQERDDHQHTRSSLSQGR